jgi:hypothetical protein
VLRARALVDLIRRGHTADPHDASRPRVEAIIEVRHNPHDPTSPHVATSDGQPLDPVTAAVLACDAWLQPIATGPTGNPLFAGRTRRLATPTQHAALVLRDGGCVFPGCDAPPSMCDAHHLIPWKDGGPTDIDHLCLLCRRHHGLAHSTDWHLQHDSEHGLAWHTPTRGTLAAQNATTRHHSTRTGTRRTEPEPSEPERPEPGGTEPAGTEPGETEPGQTEPGEPPPDDPGTGPPQRG